MSKQRGSDPSDPSDMQVGGVSGVAGANKPHAAEGIDGIEQASEVASASAIERASEVGSTGGIDGIGGIAEALAAGTIDAAQAKALLIEEAVRSQLPAGADPAFVAEVRAEVAAMFEADPILERLLRP